MVAPFPVKVAGLVGLGVTSVTLQAAAAVGSGSGDFWLELFRHVPAAAAVIVVVVLFVRHLEKRDALDTKRDELMQGLVSQTSRAMGELHDRTDASFRQVVESQRELAEDLNRTLGRSVAVIEKAEKRFE